MAETWVLNATISFPSSSLSGTFTSNGKSFTGIQHVPGPHAYLSYTSFAGGMTDSTRVYENGSWINDAYRTLVFDTAPTGAMLTWLQANGQKQSEPEPETPANVCLVNGTAYGIKTGQTLVNGTAQTIYKGRTLVAGAGYDIVLSSSEVTVTITGKGTDAGGVYASVVCSGTTYTSATQLTIKTGTTITLTVRSAGTNQFAAAKIIVDGKTVQTKTNGSASYTYTVTAGISIKLETNNYGVGSFGTVTVTTT